MEKNYVIGLDIGGTILKSGIMDNSGTIYNYRSNTINSRGSQTEILSTISLSLMNQISYIYNLQQEIRGIGIAIGGPFDYENGISYIKDLDKYDAIYGCNVKEYLYSFLPISRDIPIIFDVDSWSFARSEAKYGAGKSYSRGIIFTMGTGVGSAFFAEKQIVSEGPGVPWLGWISGQPFRDGILNDYISSAFIKRRYEELTGELADVAGIAKRAYTGDMVAQSIFTDVGTTLADYLAENHILQFGAECLIFGGQISKSFSLFSKPLIQLKSKLPCLKGVVPALDLENSCLRGLADLLWQDK